MAGGNVTDDDELALQVGIEPREISMSDNEDLEEPSKMMKTSINPFVLTFSNLRYSLNTGEAREGEILAILGPSGSGKSTLIDALANRISNESLKGCVTMNGESLESGLLKVISAYVMQDDLLFPMLTVEETLMFSAEFRLPRAISKSKKKARVQDVIHELGLRRAANTLIGDEGHRGISGGERRRVSIGVDIIHDPIVLFLDEPTSGLDSSSAFLVVKVLQRIARSGRIVIMSVHQPSSRVVGLFDQMIFLSQGETVYYGSPTQLSLFLSDFGHPVPSNQDITEFMIDLYRELEGIPGGTKSIVECNKLRQKFVEHHRLNSDYSNVLGVSIKQAIILREKLIGSNFTDIAQTSTISKFANPFWVEIIILMKRSLTNSKRMPIVFMLQIGAVVSIGCILASVYWQLDKTEAGIEEEIGFFASIVATIFFGCTDVLAVFLQERETEFLRTGHGIAPDKSCLLTGQDIVRKQGATDLSKWSCLWITLAMGSESLTVPNGSTRRAVILLMGPIFGPGIGPDRLGSGSRRKLTVTDVKEMDTLQLNGRVDTYVESKSVHTPLTSISYLPFIEFPPQKLKTIGNIPERERDRSRAGEELKNELRRFKGTETEPKSWAKSWFPHDVACEHIYSNFSESFNNMALKLRDKPLTHLVDIRKLAATWQSGDLVPAGKDLILVMCNLRGNYECDPSEERKV
ncbi:hypothetical protein C5167_000189 [Papaver somniferum]|uniref:ABC transporter domain-containing protein n=1 Tax=Papaver somniferum TaxID=3469 RepID=A0A4Y7KSH7_PAPSO|nr:hypothetical protein C5167_000189 [Papaver somniferum]